jgi:hypothetical protein
MKIIISESQLLEYMHIDGNEKIINNILEKIGKDGEAALSDKEKNILYQYANGVKPEFQKSTQEIPSDDTDSYPEYNEKPGQDEHLPELTLLFMDIYPESDNINIENENWFIEQEDTGESLNVQNESGIQFNIYPFSKEKDKIIINNNDFSFSYNLTKKIEDYNIMRKFVNSFKTQIFPQIIRKVKEQYL